VKGKHPSRLLKNEEHGIDSANVNRGAGVEKECVGGGKVVKDLKWKHCARQSEEKRGKRRLATNPDSEGGDAAVSERGETEWKEQAASGKGGL